VSIPSPRAAHHAAASGADNRSVVAALPDHVYRPARERALQDATNHGSDPVMLETLDIKSMQSQGLIEGGADGAGQPPPEQMTPERYTQIKRLASRVVAQADRGLTARRTA